MTEPNEITAEEVLTDEQKAAQEFLLGAVEEGVQFALGYIQEARRQDPVLLSLLERFVGEQIASQDRLGAVLADLLDPVKRADYPFLMVRFSGRNPVLMAAAKTDEEKLAVPEVALEEIWASKHSDGINFNDAKNLSMIIGLLCYPPLRALFLVHGLKIHFNQAKATPKPKSLLVVPNAH